MNASINVRLVTEINELVIIAERLSKDASRSSSLLEPDRIEELSAISCRGGQIIRRLYGHDSHITVASKKSSKLTNLR